MDVDKPVLISERHLCSLPPRVLRIIANKLESVQVVMLAATFDRQMLRCLSATRLLEKLDLPVFSDIVARRDMTWMQAHAVKSLGIVRKGILRAEHGSTWLTNSVVESLVRLDFNHVVLFNAPVITKVKPRFLTNMKKTIELRAIWPKMTTLEIRGDWLDPIVIQELFLHVPRSFDTLIARLSSDSYRNEFFGRLAMQNLPASTTALYILGSTSHSRSPTQNSSSASIDNFFRLQQALPNLSVFNAPFDPVIFDSADNSVLPPHCWTTSLQHVSLRTPELDRISLFPFPAKLRHFDLLVSSREESTGRIELGRYSSLNVVVKSLPFLLEELTIRNPPGPSLSFNIASSLPVNLVRLNIYHGWVYLPDMGSTLAHLVNLRYYSENLSVDDSVLDAAPGRFSLFPRPSTHVKVIDSFIDEAPSDPLTEQQRVENASKSGKPGKPGKAGNPGKADKLAKEGKNAPIKSKDLASMARTGGSIPRSPLARINQALLFLDIPSMSFNIPAREVAGFLPASLTRLRLPFETSSTLLAVLKHCPEALVHSYGILTVDAETLSLAVTQKIDVEYIHSRLSQNSFISAPQSTPFSFKDAHTKRLPNPPVTLSLETIDALFAPFAHRVFVQGPLRWERHFTPPDTVDVLHVRTGRLTSLHLKLAIDVPHMQLLPRASVIRLSQVGLELTDSMFFKIPSKSLTILDLSESPVRGPCNLSWLPPTLEEFISLSKLERQEVRWNSIPKRMRVWKTPNWQVDWIIFIRYFSNLDPRSLPTSHSTHNNTPHNASHVEPVLPHLVQLAITLGKMNDVELNSLLCQFPAIEVVNIYPLDRFRLTGAWLGTTKPLSIDFPSLASQYISYLMRGNRNITKHNLERLITTHSGRPSDILKVNWATFPSSINSFRLVHPHYLSILKQEMLPLPANWNLEYLLPNEEQAPHAIADLSKSSTSTEPTSIKFVLSNILHPKLLSAFVTLPPWVTSLHLSLDHSSSASISKSLRSLSFKDFPKTLLSFVAPQFSFHHTQEKDELTSKSTDPASTTLSANSFKKKKILNLKLHTLEFAGGYQWNEKRLASLHERLPNLKHLSLRRFVLNGSLAKETSISWDYLVGPYLGEHLPALILADAEVVRFRAKLPPTVTSLALTPEISFYDEGSNKKSVASRIQAATKDKAGAGNRSALPVSSDLPDEWNLATSLPLLGDTLTSLELNSSELMVSSKDFASLLGQVPALNRLSLGFKCLLSSNWTTALPKSLISLRLEQAVCEEASAKFELSDFPSTLIFIHVPYVFLIPPHSVEQLPVNLVRLHMANAWSPKMVECIKMSRRSIVITSSQIQEQKALEASLTNQNDIPNAAPTPIVTNNNHINSSSPSRPMASPQHRAMSPVRHSKPTTSNLTPITRPVASPTPPHAHPSFRHSSSLVSPSSAPVQSYQSPYYVVSAREEVEGKKMPSECRYCLRVPGLTTAERLHWGSSCPYKRSKKE